MSKKTGGPELSVVRVNKSGGPAFPSHASDLGPRSGMTLRDYFAAKAMQAILANPDYDENADIAEAAYWCADSMLAERDK